MTSSNDIRQDAPKKGTEHWALMVSMIALIVSGTSLWDSHKATHRDDERARPQLLPTAAHAFFIPGADTGDMSVFMGVTNTGELTATMTEVSVKPLTAGIDENGPGRVCYADILKAVPLVTPHEGTAAVILPKRSRPIVAMLRPPNSCSDIDKFLGVEVNFTYKDSLNNVYRQTEYLRADIENKAPAK